MSSYGRQSKENGFDSHSAEEQQKNSIVNSHYINEERNTNGDNDDDDKDFSYFNMICFGIAGLPYHLMFSAISVYSAKFLLDVAKIPAKYTSIILFVSRAIDAITDPLYGHFLNLSPVTKFGKMKPW